MGGRLGRVYPPEGRGRDLGRENSTVAGGGDGQLRVGWQRFVFFRERSPALPIRWRQPVTPKRPGVCAAAQNGHHKEKKKRFTAFTPVESNHNPLSNFLSV